IPRLVFLTVSLLTSGSTELSCDQKIRALFNNMYIIASCCDYNSSQKSFQPKEERKHGQKEPFFMPGNISPCQIMHFPSRASFSFRENRLFFFLRLVLRTFFPSCF